MWPQQIEIIQSVNGFVAFTKTIGCWGSTKAKSVSGLQSFLKDGQPNLSNGCHVFKMEPPGYFQFSFEQSANPLPPYAHPRQTVKNRPD